MLKSPKMERQGCLDALQSRGFDWSLAEYRQYRGALRLHVVRICRRQTKTSLHDSKDAEC